MKTIGSDCYNVQIMSSLFDPDRSAERLPVSLITGFLGSGKTTLLNRLVQRPELADSAVIINEFGEVALDHLLVAPVEGETVVLARGCLCCAVRGDLQDTLRRLLLERERGEVPAFTRILIETSGLADPAPVAQLLLNNPLLGADLRLDAIVATIDAVNGSGALDQQWEARKQAAIADRLLITKTDIAAAETIEPLILSLRQLNPAAAIHRVVDGEIDPRAAVRRRPGGPDPSVSRFRRVARRQHPFGRHVRRHSRRRSPASPRGALALPGRRRAARLGPVSRLARRAAHRLWRQAVAGQRRPECRRRGRADHRAWRAAHLPSAGHPAALAG
jgi:G3E family GTPase